jgi:hypothetical protein
VNDVYLKVFKNSGAILLAICDFELVGQTFREGKLKLDVKPDFYKGSVSSFAGALREIAEADIANLVGTGIVEAAVQKGLVDPSAVVRIAGIPHVQIIRL